MVPIYIVGVTMAMMDNVDFLVSHIRHSFITSDDTGMCELIIECDVNGNDTRGSRTFSFSGPLKRYETNYFEKFSA